MGKAHAVPNYTLYCCKLDYYCIVSDFSKLHTKGLICCVHTKFLYEKTTLSLTQEKRGSVDGLLVRDVDRTQPKRCHQT